MDSIRTQIKAACEQAEHLIDQVKRPLKPHLPAVSRFLVVVTFFEDSFRIIFQWSDQKSYLEETRSFPSFIATLFLVANVVAMLGFSSTLIAKKHVSVAIAGLSVVMVSQALVYGLVFDLLFFLRNMSITGGLLLCLSESLLRQRKKSVFGSLPQLSEIERHMYFQLAGRVLLVLLFIGFVIHGQWSLTWAIVSLVGLAACVMVIVGFRAKWSATLLVSLLSVMNVLVNNWWSIQHSSPHRDFRKYDFFQTLSIVGGLMLLISIGPGNLSYDEKKEY
ncbi:hypothetical protein PHYBLDRAFT_155389 [Phycomyces blakesleeanus NRRL 1555(-)]|uniref:SURF4-domain-containing protein n=2 Tax=Phycomyces blakesleeanus TaxID=4837 RepID=A0A162U760_PHYB8|nr:hypothetical protein PHYBLDRAFT_155389 [Phycomyces blakesleeanus NRRL 1555(-)]OAD74002.1 hypothetical protein PHYBLDRAFT_155389 [Phycomyces blakesleeanus NRRL 1555(-)]|eukprot:XP_018292042.1 hypothetical protein PHYBLDRAFT_155389 [Phycomyces blakesleeanus NRRL 1555(-)]